MKLNLNLSVQDESTFSRQNASVEGSIKLKSGLNHNKFSAQAIMLITVELITVELATID